MDVHGTYELKAPRSQVWEALNDPEVLRQCTPGCKKLLIAEDGTYDVLLEVGIAAVKGQYDGKIKITDRVPESEYKLSVSGSGKSGFVSAQGTIRMVDFEQGTLLEYFGEAHVGGPVAGVGQRIMQGVAKQIVGQFFKSFGKLVGTPQAQAGEPTAGS